MPRALLQLAAFYPLSVLGMVLGGFMLFSDTRWPWLLFFTPFYGYFLQALWSCFRRGNRGFLLAFLGVALQGGSTTLGALHLLDGEAVGGGGILLILAVFCLVGLAGAWEALRRSHHQTALWFTLTGLSIPLAIAGIWIGYSQLLLLAPGAFLLQGGLVLHLSTLCLELPESTEPIACETSPPSPEPTEESSTSWYHPGPPPVA